MSKIPKHRRRTGSQRPTEPVAAQVDPLTLSDVDALAATLGGHARQFAAAAERWRAEMAAGVEPVVARYRAAVTVAEIAHDALQVILANEHRLAAAGRAQLARERSGEASGDDSDPGGLPEGA